MITPITATSEIAGCSSKRASNSAGATWLPLTLINSCSLVSFFLLLKKIKIKIKIKIE